ncbi:MAG: VCBS repeat-containing protein [Pyrinomonadaceae bacterium]|nr:VCBS repeat-containing protein [Pyrinomonadaceae bacterium]
MQIVFAPVTGNFNAAAQDNSDAPAAIIYDNGQFQTGATSKSGVAAPSGAQWSEVQNFAGDLTNANTSAGLTCNQGGFRAADNFVVPVGETWTINSVPTFAYLTGGTATTPFTAATLRIWRGRPGDAGSTVIFGDTTTNRLASSTDTNSFRIFNTVAPSPGSPPGTTRRIWQNTLTVAPALALTTGDYWVDWATTVNSNPATAHFCPNTTIVDTRYTPIMNARQFNVATSAWVDAVDTGNPAAAIDLPQDFPFKLDGTKSGARTVPYSRKIDLGGDNRTDYTLTRNMSGAKIWFTNDNATGTTSGVQFGSTGDVNVPEDYNGDGRTDIAVWRAGTFAFFYILQSGTNTFRAEQFGQTGDDPTVIGDYDGDGRADPAVYRAGTGGSAGIFFYRASTSTASGNITRFAFGAAGDKPYPGDFDGDGRFDFSVIRNNGGNAQIFQQNSTAGFSVTNFGLFTDRFVTGDFDGDYRNDLAVIRDDGGVLRWFVNTSTSSQSLVLQYGTTATDTPTPGDYDGDSRTDFGVFRNTGVFFNFGTLSAPRQRSFGQSGDTPAAAYLVH